MSGSFRVLSPGGPLWEKTAAYAQACSWRAGESLARAMRTGALTGWETVIAALDETGALCGFCTISRHDCMPDLAYTPYIGYVFVDEAHRGRRLSQAMIAFASEHLKELGFGEVYLTSDHEGLYEKYGFEPIDRHRAYWGGLETIYRKSL